MPRALFRQVGSEDMQRSAQYVNSTSRTIRNNTKLKLRVKALKNDGSLSWIVMSRGMNKYVEERNEEKGESPHHEKISLQRILPTLLWNFHASTPSTFSHHNAATGSDDKNGSSATTTTLLVFHDTEGLMPNCSSMLPAQAPSLQEKR